MDSAYKGHEYSQHELMTSAYSEFLVKRLIIITVRRIAEQSVIVKYHLHQFCNENERMKSCTILTIMNFKKKMQGLLIYNLHPFTNIYTKRIIPDISFQ